MNLLGGLALLFGKLWGITISPEVRWRVNNILWNCFKKNAGGKRALKEEGKLNPTANARRSAIAEDPTLLHGRALCYYSKTRRTAHGFVWSLDRTI